MQFAFCIAKFAYFFHGQSQNESGCSFLGIMMYSLLILTHAHTHILLQADTFPDPEPAPQEPREAEVKSCSMRQNALYSFIQPLTPAGGDS